MPTTPKAPSTPVPTPFGKLHPCPEHKVIREKIDKLEGAHEKNEGRRWSLVIAAAGSLVCIVIAIVTMGLYFGDLSSTLKHMARDKQTDRDEIQQLRQSSLVAERQQMAQDQEILRSLIEIRTKLDALERRVSSLESDGGRRRARGAR